MGVVLIVYAADHEAVAILILSRKHTIHMMSQKYTRCKNMCAL